MFKLVEPFAHFSSVSFIIYFEYNSCFSSMCYIFIVYYTVGSILFYFPKFCNACDNVCDKTPQEFAEGGNVSLDNFFSILNLPFSMEPRKTSEYCLCTIIEINSFQQWT